MSGNSSDNTIAQEIVATIIGKGIKVLALDFDKTIIDVHTAGMWRGGSPKLAEHVRPSFKALIEAALECKEEMFVSIVTYSMQPTLIKEVLKLALPKSCDINRIIIRANSKEWLPVQGPGTPFLGKQQHIAWITTLLYNSYHLLIEPQEILLLDDDSENVALALEFGHMAYEVPDSITLENIKEYVDNLEVKKREVAVTDS